MSDLMLLPSRILRRLAMPLVWLALCGYLGYHAFVGDRGVYTHWRLEGEEASLQAELANLIADRKRMEQRIALISPRSLDQDMLDERVRAVLNFAHPDEIVILRKAE